MKNLSLVTVLLLTFAIYISAQVTSTTVDGRNNAKPAQAEQAEARIQQITSDSGRYFKQGLLNLQDNRRPQARDDFDKSVEVFLISGINLDSNNNVRARDCYNQLIETLYRMEFPNQAQIPQIRSLSATCGWNIDNDLADKVAKIIVTAPTQQTPANNSALAAVVPNTNPLNEVVQGFAEQRFEPSNLDELSELELTPEESNISTKSSLRTVKAVSGDTIAKIAQRYGINPVDLANLNGFTSINAATPAGTVIKISGEYTRPSIAKDEKTNLLQSRSCDLTIADSPVLRGVKLGMSIAMVSKILGVTLENGHNESIAPIPSLKNRNGNSWDLNDPVYLKLLEEKGYEGSLSKKKEYVKVNVPGLLTFAVYGKGNKALDGVSMILLSFLDNRLFSMNFNYATDAFNNMSDKEFVTAIAATLKLPERYWGSSGSVFCNDLSVFSYRYKSTVSITVNSRTIEAIVNKRKSDALVKMYDALKAKTAEELKKKIEEKGFKP